VRGKDAPDFFIEERDVFAEGFQLIQEQTQLPHGDVDLRGLGRKGRAAAMCSKRSCTSSAGARGGCSSRLGSWRAGRS